jgi:microcystin-dependent protein
VDYPKSVPSVGLKDGKFIDENPVTGQVGSLISSEWGNAVTDELLNVIRAGGEEPAEAEHDQLLAAIKVIVKDNIPPEQVRTTLAQYGITDAYTKSVTYTKAEIEALLKNMSALPVGAMVPFPTGTVPAGFLEVNGSVQSAAEYPDLAAYLGTTFNTGGEAAGVFRLPESRGEFLRGWDHGRGVDAGRAIGSLQAAEMAAHSHYNSLRASAEGNILALTVFGAPSSVGSSRVFQTSTGNYADAGNYPVSTTGGAETRPRNLAVMWCIKAWNAPINQGNIDIAALAALLVSATATRSGLVRLATSVELVAGTDMERVVTPAVLESARPKKGDCTGWVNFNGTGTVSIRDSYNCLSITDNGTGDFTCNWINQAVASYSFSSGASLAQNSGAVSLRVPESGAIYSATQLRLLCSAGAGSVFDPIYGSVQIFGGKS